MRNVLIVFIVINILYFVAALFWQPKQMSDIPLVDKGVPPIEVLKELPGSHYRASSAPGSSSCFTAGPYFSETVAQLIARKIRDYGLQVVIRTLNGLHTLNYLVYLEPLNSRTDAENIIKDLADFKVKDYSIVESGPYKNAVSFGSFKDLGKAKRHTEYIRYLGYDAKFTSQNVKRKVYWLDYDEPLGMGTPLQTWSHSIDTELDIQIIPRACS